MGTKAISKLPPLPIHFDEPRHKYVWQGDGADEVMAYSVTQICNRKTAEQMARIEETRHIWQPRGDTIHLFAKHMNTGEALPNPGDYAAWTEPLLDHPFWNDFEPIAAEYPMCDRRLSVGGSLDALGYYKGVLTLLDFKSQSSTKSGQYDCTPQLGGYCQMLFGHHRLSVQACRVIWVKPGRTVVGTAHDPEQCELKYQECVEEFFVKKELEEIF